jgi:uncharacterized protein YegP (UPF0339 family)
MYFEIYQSIDGWFYWRLKSSNHKTVADGSEGYVSQQGALHTAYLLFKELTLLLRFIRYKPQ